MPRPLYLGLQVDVGQRHLGDLVEADGQRDGTEDEEAVVDGHPHQNHRLHLRSRRFYQEGADEINHQEEEADGQEEQVERKSADKSGASGSGLVPEQQSSDPTQVKLPVLQQRR